MNVTLVNQLRAYVECDAEILQTSEEFCSHDVSSPENLCILSLEISWHTRTHAVLKELVIMRNTNNTYLGELRLKGLAFAVTKL